MTDEVQKPDVPAADKNTSLLASVPVGGAMSAILAIAGAALGAGWPGVVALAASGVGLFFAWNWIVKQYNSRVDSADLEHAGADSGNTAADVANQGHAVSSGLDDLEKMNPPIEAPNK